MNLLVFWEHKWNIKLEWYNSIYRILFKYVISCGAMILVSWIISWLEELRKIACPTQMCQASSCGCRHTFCESVCVCGVREALTMFVCQPQWTLLVNSIGNASGAHNTHCTWNMKCVHEWPSIILSDVVVLSIAPLEHCISPCSHRWARLRYIVIARCGWIMLHNVIEAQ